jgi:lipopolysaccharide transport system permease protein
MLAHAQKLFSSKDLTLAWTGRNIRARYQQSALGWLWAVIQPAAQVAIFTLVFTMFVPIDTGSTPYVVFSYVAIAPWSLLSAALPDMANSLVDNMSLVTKIYFPREILPISAMLARLMDFGIGIVVIALLLFFYQMPVSLMGLLWLPLILAIELILIVGLGLACAALNVFFRDVRSLLGLVIQLWFYASPILYPASLVPDTLRPYYYLNPMSGILVAYRDILLEQRLPNPYLLLPAILISAVLFVGGYWLFKRVEFRFADVV